MSIKVHIGSFLSQYTGNPHIVEINGDTVRECLKNLMKQFPKLELFDKDGSLFTYVDIYFNKEIIDPKKLDKPVKDKDELSILFMFDGG